MCISSCLENRGQGSSYQEQNLLNAMINGDAHLNLKKKCTSPGEELKDLGITRLQREYPNYHYTHTNVTFASASRC